MRNEQDELCFDIILRSLRSKLSAQNRSDLSIPPAPLSADLDLDRLIFLAETNRALPQLSEYLPSSDRLKTAITRYQRKSLANTALLLKLQRLFDSNRLPCLAFKGPVLSTQIYGDPTYRMSSDLDLLFPREHIETAYRHMRSLGFEHHSSLPSNASVSDLLKHKKDICLWNRETYLAVELHIELTDFPKIPNSDFATLWDCRKPISIGGQTLQTLSDDINLIYLCAHGHHHGWERLNWLLDFALFYSSRFSHDFDRVESLAKSHDLCEEFEIALRLSHSFLKLPLPTQLSSRLEKKFKSLEDRVKELQSDLVHESGPSLVEKSRFWSMASEKKRFQVYHYVYSLSKRTWASLGRPLFSFHLWALDRWYSRLRKSHDQIF